MNRILICDDHSSIRKGVKLILEGEFAGIIFGEASNGVEVMRKLHESEWDILILDINMPGRNGLEVLQQIRAEKMDVPVLLFSMHMADQFAIRALQLGAAGYLSKDSNDQELIDAIKMVMNGRKYISSAVAEQLANFVEKPLNKMPHELLSDREYQTLVKIAGGKTVTEIAGELCLSIPTISTYRSRILEKMEMRSSAELITYSIRNNLV